MSVPARPWLGVSKPAEPWARSERHVILVETKETRVMPDRTPIEVTDEAARRSREHQHLADAVRLQSIHRHPFGDVYAWAGRFRTVSTSKGDSTFRLASRIEVGMAAVRRDLDVGRLSGLSPTPLRKRPGASSTTSA